MGKSNKQDECGDPTLRRSTRKRKVKRESDFDYDSDFNGPEVMTVSRVSPKIVRTQTPSPISMSFPVRKNRGMETPEPIEKDQSMEYYKEASSSSLPTLNVVNMKPREIIDTHCKMLERRLEKVAYDYIEGWTYTPPKLIVPRCFLGGDADRYSASEPDDVAVCKVVNDMLDVVSYLNK
ncbi:unnamed protein product [Caenorhabditis sp. 36 PRJEB53466]|nr:unnamed protein product [Caenorhabditis sp. 36 PRJEB53466]